jgi:hypothetical protein
MVPCAKRPFESVVAYLGSADADGAPHCYSHQEEEIDDEEYVRISTSLAFLTF